MKHKVILVLIVMLSLIAGFFIGQQTQPLKSVPFSTLSSEQTLINEVKEKCRTADQKGKSYFKKYGNSSTGKEPLNNPEWVDAQSWEQACIEAIDELRALWVSKISPTFTPRHSSGN